MNKFSLGCDPELFLIDAAGALVSAIGKIGGTKEAPRPIDGLEDGFAVQEDNVALEFNIPPSGSKEVFAANVGAALSQLRDEVNMYHGLDFSAVSAALFPVEQLQDPRAQEFGCDPDFNAWTGKRNPRPQANDPTLRSCGGHVHIGYKFATKDAAKQFIKYLDLFLGVPSVLMDTGGDMRRELYGKPGAYRIKPYGVEYRTLSNFWVQDNNKCSWVWDSVDRAFTAMQEGKLDIDALEGTIIDTINNSDKTTARELVKQFNLLVI